MIFGQMKSSLTKIAGVAVVAAGLAGCVDVTMELEAIDTETARGTFTMVMDKQMYDMAQAQGSEEFCDPEAELIVGDTTVTCIDETVGSYEDVIDAAEDEEAPTIVPQGDGTVRITFPTATLTDEFGAPSDPQELAMMTTMFEGKNLTLVASGGKVVDTNMDLAEDGMSASFSIPFVDLMSGTVELPAESYAVIELD